MGDHAAEEGEYVIEFTIHRQILEYVMKAVCLKGEIVLELEVSGESLRGNYKKNRI